MSADTFRQLGEGFADASPSTIVDILSRAPIVDASWQIPTVIASHAAPAASSWPVVYPSTFQDVPIPVRQWCVPEWVPDKVVTLLSGDGGTGKSLIAMQLATCCAMGLPFLGMDLARRKVLYLAAEDDQDELHRRQADINAGLGIGMADLEENLMWKVISGGDTLLAELDEKTKRLKPTPTYTNLAAFCVENGVQLVIVDTVADTFGGSEIDRQQVTRYVRLLEDVARRTSGAAILLAHPSVAGLKDGTGISGSSAWRNAVRSVIYMRRPANEEADEPGARDLRIIERLKGNFAALNGLLRVRYFEGHFLREEGGADVSGRLIEPIITEVKVMRSIRDALKAGKWLSPAKNSSDYAPRLLKRYPELKGFSLLNIQTAIESMTVKGELREAHVGPSNNRRRVLVPADHPPLGGETDPLTGERMDRRP